LSLKKYIITLLVAFQATSPRYFHQGRRIPGELQFLPWFNTLHSLPAGSGFCHTNSLLYTTENRDFAEEGWADLAADGCTRAHSRVRGGPHVYKSVIFCCGNVA